MSVNNKIHIRMICGYNTELFVGLSSPWLLTGRRFTSRFALFTPDEYSAETVVIYSGEQQS